MEIEKFVNNFVEQLDEVDNEIITAKTEFRGIEDWSSLMALSIIAMVDAEYNVKLKGDDLRNSVTIEDLFNIVVSRKK